MQIHYYFTIFPMEGLVASQLDPDDFGSYMATGSKKGSSERLIFCELAKEFGSDFDWNYAHENCIEHPNGDPKNSLYLSIYRVLEYIPLEAMGNLFLTNTDGRTLKLERQEYREPETVQQFFVYKELCPVTPIVVSSLPPKEFAVDMTTPKTMTYVPKLVFADLKIIDFKNPDETGNIGKIYERKTEHLKDCVYSVTEVRDKVSKVFDRSQLESFSFQTIREGIYMSDGSTILEYPMKTIEELREHHYDWARSAMII